MGHVEPLWVGGNKSLFAASRLHDQDDRNTNNQYMVKIFFIILLLQNQLTD